jgi:hypothetical protein
MIVTSTSTTAVEPIVCLREGHVTFFNSIFTSLKNCIDLVTKLSFTLAGAGLETAEDFRSSTLLSFFSTLGASGAVVAAPRSLLEALALAALSRFFFLADFFRCRRPNVTPD